MELLFVAADMNLQAMPTFKLLILTCCHSGHTHADIDVHALTAMFTSIVHIDQN